MEVGKRTAEEAIRLRDEFLAEVVTADGYDAALQAWHFAKHWNAIAKNKTTLRSGDIAPQGRVCAPGGGLVGARGES